MENESYEPEPDLPILLKQPIIVLHKIVNTLFRTYYMEYDDGDVYYVEKLSLQQKELLRVSQVCTFFRNLVKPYLFRDLLLEVDCNGEILSYPNLRSAGAEYVRYLYIRIQAKGTINPRIIWESICNSIAGNLSSLETILIDTSTSSVTPEYTFELENFRSMAQLEHIVSVHVLGRFVESGSREVTNNGAMVLAKEIVSSLPHRHMFRRLDLDEALMIDISYKAVIPLFTYNPEPPIGNQYSSVGHITRLLFSDINLVIGASDLIKRCSKTLVRLTFMLCDYDVFKEIVYDYTDDPIVLKKKGRPVVYANLHSIHGALNRRNGSSEAYVVSGMTFPKLEFFHEVIEYSWQGMMGVVPHLLANVLLGSDLPRLKVIRLRTAQTMVLEARKLPSLEYVSYYQHSKEVRSISGTKIAAQLFRLLSIKRLQFLRFHDQMPPIRLDSIPSIQCLDLRYMDLGVMILSLTTVVRLLRSLLHLHTAAFAVNNYWAQISLGDNQRLSDSLERLSLYVIGSDLTADDGYTSSEEIISRLPNLYILSLQSEAEKTQRFFENTKNRFSWSQKVAERLRITQEDLFSRINK